MMEPPCALIEDRDYGTEVTYVRENKMMII